MRYVIAGLMAGLAICGFALAEAKPPLKVCMLSGSGAYKSDESLTAFKPFLESRYDMICTPIKGGSVFYASLGGPDDFKDTDFKQMIVNALFWTAKRGVEKR